MGSSAEQRESTLRACGVATRVRDPELDRLARIAARAVGGHVVIALGDPPWVGGLGSPEGSPEGGSEAPGALLDRALPLREGILEGRPARAIHGPEGIAVGHVVALVSREWSDVDARTLSDVALTIERALELRIAARYAQAERIAQVGFWIWDPARDEMMWSSELHRIHGVEELPGSLQGYLEHVHPDDRDELRARLEEAVRTRSPFEVRSRILPPTGEIRHVLTRGTVSVAADGEPLEVFGTALDVTSEVADAEALRRTKEWLEIALDATGIGVWEWNLTTGRFAWSPGVERVLQLPPDAYTFQAFLDCVVEHDRPRVEAETRRAIESGSEVSLEYQIRDGEGKLRWISDRGVVVRGPGGTRLIGTISDVTAQKQADEKQRRTAEQLRHVQKMEAIGRLAAGVAHDFNNLLTIVEGSVQIVRRAGPAAELALGQIEGAVERAAALTRQLLAVSRQHPVQLVVVDLSEITRAVLELVQRTLPPSVQVGAEIEPGAYVRADRSQLEQVVLNLLVNARDAMPGGGTLGVSLSTSGTSVRLSVSDTGVGMSPEVLARVFEPFYSTRERGGGGLGLAQVHGIVGQFGGHVDVMSAAKRGSTFTVTLPRAPGPPTALPAVPTGEAAGDRLRQESILLVEDYSEVRRVVRTMLEGSGYSVLEAVDADAALTICRNGATPIDLLLTDVQLPRMSGPELARRARELRPDLSVLFMSGQLDAGAPAPSPLLQKPFGGATLDAAVRAVLERKR